MQNDTDKKKYWDGGKNKAVRLWFYCQRGLDFFNAFRYILMAIFGAYVLLKLDNPWLMVLMFLVAVPVLIFAGWCHVHQMAATINFLDVEFGSSWTKYGYSLSERSVRALEEINENLKNIKKYESKKYSENLKNIVDKKI